MEFAVFSRRMLTGTVSDLPPATRIAWIVVLFEAERLHGKVKLPVRDLAKMASISTPEAAEALKVFQEPDPYSSSKEFEGRRLIPVEGEEDWYVVATWEKHAQERAAFFARLRQQRARSRHGTSRTVTDRHGASRSVTNELEPEPELEPKEPKALSGKPTPDFLAVARAVEKIDVSTLAEYPPHQIVIGWFTSGITEELITETLVDCEDKYRGKHWRYLEKILIGRRDNAAERPGQRRAPGAGKKGPVTPLREIKKAPRKTE